jgi:hypothetical protein
MDSFQHLSEAYNDVLEVYRTAYLKHNSETTSSLRSTAADLGVRQSPNGLDLAMKCPSCSAVYDVSMCGACSKRLEACVCPKPRLSAIPFHLHWHCPACCADTVGPYNVKVPKGAASVLGMTDIPEVLLALRVALADLAVKSEDFDKPLGACAEEIGSVWNCYSRNHQGLTPEDLGIVKANKTLLFYGGLAETDVVLRAFYEHQSQPLQNQHLVSVMAALDFGKRAEPHLVVACMSRALQTICQVSKLTSAEKVKQAMLLANDVDLRVGFVIALFLKGLYVPYNTLADYAAKDKNIQSRKSVLAYDRYERVLKIADTMFLCMAMLWTPGSFTANAISVAGFETMFRLLVKKKEAYKKDCTPVPPQVYLVSLKPSSFMKAIMASMTAGYRPADYPYPWMRLLGLGPVLGAIKNVLLRIFRRCTLEKTSVKLVCASHLGRLVPFLKQLGRGSLQPGTKTYATFLDELDRVRQLPATAHFYLKFCNSKTPTKLSCALAEKFDTDLKLNFKVDASNVEHLEFLKRIERKPRKPTKKPKPRLTSLPSGANSLFGQVDHQDDNAPTQRTRKSKSRLKQLAQPTQLDAKKKKKKRNNSTHNTKRLKPTPVQVQYGVGVACFPSDEPSSESREPRDESSSESSTTGGPRPEAAPSWDDILGFLSDLQAHELRDTGLDALLGDSPVVDDINRREHHGRQVRPVEQPKEVAKEEQDAQHQVGYCGDDHEDDDFFDASAFDDDMDRGVSFK